MDKIKGGKTIVILVSLLFLVNFFGLIVYKVMEVLQVQFELLRSSVENESLKLSDMTAIYSLGVSIASLGVSFLGVILTALFSFLVYKVSKVTAEATVTSVELSKLLYEQHHKDKIELKREYTMDVISNGVTVWEVIHEATSIDYENYSTFCKKIGDVSHETGLNQEQFAIYFDEKERAMIRGIWTEFKAFKEHYLTNSDGSLKAKLSPHEISLIHEAAKKSSDKIEANLVSLLRSINRHST
ncbi:hypothetical protein I532_01545 [Brevibacillus borstelensis AK1]|uniref:Uncharacterized protein n=1 Tax=Brevibacillus borstelensis AK1 TaxID=1300222 RepID=M8DD60_9BACL|nr:hypothetical protein [Brevibacillus borstelensis]EMT54249.1 hypothetical protein I532_01545 [Brevibacillus borstelensis AK1]